MLKMAIHSKMFVDCLLVITSKVKPFYRPDKTWKEELMVQPVFCIVDTGFSFYSSIFHFNWLF